MARRAMQIMNDGFARQCRSLPMDTENGAFALRCAGTMVCRLTSYLLAAIINQCLGGVYDRGF